MTGLELIKHGSFLACHNKNSLSLNRDVPQDPAAAVADAFDLIHFLHRGVAFQLGRWPSRIAQ